MTLKTLQTLTTLFTRDDERLDADDTQRLIDASKDHGLVSADEREHLRALSTASTTTLPARNALATFLAQPWPPANVPLRSLEGDDPSSFADDRLLLPADGSLRGHSGVTPYTRSYAAVSHGPMRLVHGSPAPASTVLSADELRTVRTQSPGAALDAAARERGVRLSTGFDALANAKSSYDPNAEFWWGKCHAWAWSALSTELAARVDVGGPEGQRGLWLSGQWISRADLGNVLMTVADRIALRDEQAFINGPVSAKDLLQATAQFLLAGGGGFVADIHNDAAHGGEREVWNQPFVAADVDAKTLSGPGAEAVLALAQKDGTPGVAVKHVHVVGRYGNEHSDGYEGPWNAGSRSWNVYAVLDGSGTVVAAYQADDARLEGARGLPTRQSHELPEYFWKPSLNAIDAGLSGARSRAIDQDPLAGEYRFFVGTVLTKGVPGSMRAAFETEVARLPAGAVTPEVSAALVLRFPGVAEAYTAAQWERAFGQRGLAREAFALR